MKRIFFIEFNGIEYPARTILLDGRSVSGDRWHGEYVVSTESLDNAIEQALNNTEDPFDKEAYDRAVYVDNRILFYVPDNLIGAADQELSEYVVDNI